MKNSTLASLLSYAMMLAINSAHADMQALTEETLADISGQGGVYLSGEFAINKEGGPLWDDPAEVSGFTPGTRPYYTTNGSIDSDRAADVCDNGICGLRLAIKLNENSEGWYVIDDLSGGFAFEGLTLRTRLVGDVVDYDVWDSGTGDFAVGNVSKEILEIGLPGTVSFNKFKFKFAVANNGEFGVPMDNGKEFRQTEIFGVQINGDLNIQGNLLMFPVE